MSRRKKSLKFKKIKIANINFIKGGDDTNEVSVIIACQSVGDDCQPNEATNIHNPCSDGCLSGVGFGDRTEGYSYNVEKCYNIIYCH